MCPGWVCNLPAGMRVPLSLDSERNQIFRGKNQDGITPENKIWQYSRISNSNSEICLGPRTHTDIQFSICLHFIVNNHDKRVTFIVLFCFVFFLKLFTFILLLVIYLSWPDVKVMESIVSSIKMCSSYLFMLHSGIPRSEFIHGPQHHQAGTLVIFPGLVCSH